MFLDVKPGLIALKVADLYYVDEFFGTGSDDGS